MLTLSFAAALALLGPQDVPTPAAAPTVDAGRLWGADYFTNVELTTHSGRRLKLFDDMLKDRVVLINFIYTRCPDACPLETAKLCEVYELLRDYVGKEIHFYSITVDPEFDTPQVLAEYAQRFHTGPGWEFLTGTKADIRQVREKLGMIRSDETQLADHTLSMLLGHQRLGRWIKRSPMENPFMLAHTLASWIQKSIQPLTPMQEFAAAPTRLRNMDPGEELYRTRCASCHLLGADDGLQRLGPNLLGITERREANWLRRWILEPDALIAEGDSQALAVLEAHGQLPMPNLRLDARQADELVEYMRAESVRFYSQSRQSDSDEEPRSCCQKETDLMLRETPSSPSPESSSDRGVLAASAAMGLGLACLLGLRVMRRRR